MKPSIVLTASGIYLALVGLGFLFVPDTMMFGTLGAGASAAVVWTLRGFGGAMLGIAVIDLLARNAEASVARNAIFMGATIGYGLVGITAAIEALTVGTPIAWVYSAVSILFAIWFFLVGRSNMAPAAR